MTTRNPLSVTRTNPDRAEAALSALYRQAGLDEPEFIWAMSPKAGFEKVRQELDDRGESMREAAVERLMAGYGEQVCLCPWCRAVSVNWLIHGRAIRGEIPMARRRRAETAVSDLVLAALVADIPSLSTMRWPEPGLGATALLTRPFCNPWLTAEVDGHRPLGSTAETAIGPRWSHLGRSAGWWWPYDGFAVLSARPQFVSLDEQGRLQCETGPALVYPDGWSVNVIDGVLLPEFFFSREITLADVTGETNLEVRRMLIDRYGPDRFIQGTGGRLISEDETGQLWQTSPTAGRTDPVLEHRQRMNMIRVVDSTPRPDGTHRVYWLHVPPDMRTAREAVAWTFGLKPGQYKPEVQT